MAKSALDRVSDEELQEAVERRLRRKDFFSMRLPEETLRRWQALAKRLRKPLAQVIEAAMVDFEHRAGSR